MNARLRECKKWRFFQENSKNGLFGPRLSKIWAKMVKNAQKTKVFLIFLKTAYWISLIFCMNARLRECKKETFLFFFRKTRKLDILGRVCQKLALFWLFRCPPKWVFFTFFALHTRRTPHDGLFVLKIKKWIRRRRFHFFTKNLKMAPFWRKMVQNRHSLITQKWFWPFFGIFSGFLGVPQNYIFWSFNSVFWQFLCEKNGRKSRDPARRLVLYDSRVLKCFQKLLLFYSIFLVHNLRVQIFIYSVRSVLCSLIPHNYYKRPWTIWR